MCGRAGEGYVCKFVCYVERRNREEERAWRKYEGALGGSDEVTVGLRGNEGEYHSGGAEKWRSGEEEEWRGSEESRSDVAGTLL